MYRSKRNRRNNVILAACFFTIANFLFWNLNRTFDQPPAQALYSLSAVDSSGLLRSLLDSEVTVKIEHKGHLNFVETVSE